MPETSAEPRLEIGDAGELKLHGALALERSGPVLKEVARRALAASSKGGVRFDLSGADRVDSGVLAILVTLQRRLASGGGRAEIVGVDEKGRAMLELLKGLEAAPRTVAKRRLALLDDLGTAAAHVGAHVLGTLSYVGDLTVAAGRAIRRPASVRWGDVGKLCERAGADGVPIVLLLGFLIGLVMAFQGAIQLKRYGANIFVADLVAIALARELGPLMTAIIVAGRSGASFAAELGTMKVSEEIDALRTLGMDPHRFLVIPRVVALVLVLPVLALLADVVGILGGLLIGVTSLDLSPTAYLTETKLALSVWDVTSGLVKTIAFALAISIVSCERGLSTERGAEGVGRSTTSAVVTSIFLVIAIDSVFTVVYNALGL